MALFQSVLTLLRFLPMRLARTAGASQELMLDQLIDVADIGARAGPRFSAELRRARLK